MYATLVDAPHSRDAAKGPELALALQRFGAFVLTEGLEGMIAAQVLHGHFWVAEGEAILDSVDINAREIMTRVVPIDQVTADQEAVWGFTTDGTPVVLGWSDDAHVDTALMAAVIKAGAFLARERLTTALAVVTRDEPFPLEPAEMLLERTDEGSRTQRTTVVSRGDIPPERTATWYFKLGDSQKAAGCHDGTLATRGHIQPADVVPVAVTGCDPGC
jgi:hypothetical protein